MSKIQCNVGRTERVIRVVIGLISLAAGLYFKTWWGALGFLPLLTAVIGWCPVSGMLGVSTCSDPGSTLKDTSIYEEEHPLRLGDTDKKL